MTERLGDLITNRTYAFQLHSFPAHPSCTVHKSYASDFLQKRMVWHRSAEQDRTFCELLTDVLEQLLTVRLGQIGFFWRTVLGSRHEGLDAAVDLPTRKPATSIAQPETLRKQHRWTTPLLEMPAAPWPADRFEDIFGGFCFPPRFRTLSMFPLGTLTRSPVNSEEDLSNYAA